MKSLTKWTTIARRLPSPLYKLASQAYVDYSFPRHIFIETTSACQLSCQYCPREKRSDHMDFNLFRSIVDECKTHGPRSFSLHLFGDPLLYPDILKAIDYIKGADRRNTILLTTNGVLLNRFANSLGNVDRVIWSYRKNNFNEDSMRLLRKKGLIRLLVEETPKEEFEKWSKFPRVEVKSLHNYGGNIDISKWGVKKEPTRWPCYHLWFAPAIRWNGEITLCCNIPKLGQEVFDVYSPGAIERYWKSDALSKVRESHRAGIYSGACMNCDSYKSYPNIFFEAQCQKPKKSV